MNILKTFFIVVFCATTVSVASGQHSFTNCSAAFLDNKIMVNEYSPEAYCEILQAATGELTVQTANLSPENSFPTGKIAFKVAIRDGNTKTLMSFSDNTYKQLDIKKLLSKCRPGDSIVLLTLDDEYALPHNEILVK